MHPGRDRGGEGCKGGAERAGDFRIGGDAPRVEPAAEQRHGGRSLRRQPGRHGAQRFQQRRLAVGCARRGIDQRHRLVRKFQTAHQPVEGVLQHAGDAMRIFRAGNQQPVAVADQGTEFADLSRRMRAVEIGVEGRQRCQALIEGDRHAVGGEQARGQQDRRVRRYRPKAARNGQNTHEHPAALTPRAA